MKTRNVLLLIIAIAGISMGVYAGSKKYDAVLMEMDNKIYFYLVGADSKPLSNKGVTGKATFTLATGEKVKVTLAKQGDKAFVVNESIADFTTANASFKVEEGNVFAKFKNKYMTGTDEKKYVCTMHPEELSNSAGKCPHCGMGLVSKTFKTYQPTKSNRPQVTY